MALLDLICKGREKGEQGYLLAKSETMEDKGIGVRKLRECLC